MQQDKTKTKSNLKIVGSGKPSDSGREKELPEGFTDGEKFIERDEVPEDEFASVISELLG